MWWWPLVPQFEGPLMIMNRDVSGSFIFTWHEQMSKFTVPLMGSFLGARPMFDSSFDLIAPTLLIGMMRLCFVVFVTNRMAHSVSGDPKRWFNYPPEWTLKGFQQRSDEDNKALHPMFSLYFVCSFTVYMMHAICPFMFTRPSFLSNGDDGMLAYLHLAHAVDLIFLVMNPITYCIFWKLFLFKIMKGYTLKAKHLLSAQALKSRLKIIGDTERSWTIIIACVTIQNTVLMPFGIAMQSYGISNVAFWPSPMNYLFNVPGAANNLLGAPVFFLMSKAITVGLFVRFTDLRWKD